MKKECERFAKAVALAAVVALMSGCGSPGQQDGKESGLEIVFLTRSTCANTPVMRERLLEAIGTLELETNLIAVDVGALAPDDYRTGYGTPTVLVGGADLFGAPKPRPATPI